MYPTIGEALAYVVSVYAGKCPRGLKFCSMFDILINAGINVKKTVWRYLVSHESL